MNQHQRARELGVLNGTFSVDGDGDLTCPCADTLFGIVTGSAHMHIAADALNAMNTHGHTPSEMVEIIRELREALQFLIALDDRMNDPEYEESGTYMGAYYAYYKGEYKTWEAAKAALTKTEDFR